MNTAKDLLLMRFPGSVCELFVECVCVCVLMLCRIFLSSWVGGKTCRLWKSDDV